MKGSADQLAGAVAASNAPSQNMAAARLSPHISADGCRPPQKAGRSGRPKTLQRIASSNCTHGTPAGLPLGMPGKGLVMEGAVQQAPHWGRQFMDGKSSEAGRALPAGNAQALL
ncbi:hypothetical protein FB599_2296 [Herbaspirillum sp. SJZ130]|nr:hypothetical protein [Herbaspirillum sp. SJZ102]TQK06150.1 hypothetical protein FB599_2296 [Herbaspirillum sp. SJZ130]